MKIREKGEKGKGSEGGRDEGGGRAVRQAVAAFSCRLRTVDAHPGWAASDVTCC